MYTSVLQQEQQKQKQNQHQRPKREENKTDHKDPILIKINNQQTKIDRCISKGRKKTKIPNRKEATTNP